MRYKRGTSTFKRGKGVEREKGGREINTYGLDGWLVVYRSIDLSIYLSIYVVWPCGCVPVYLPTHPIIHSYTYSVSDSTHALSLSCFLNTILYL